MKLHLAEMSRRGVLKTLAAYAVASWVIVEVAAVLAPAFRLPDWTVAAVATLLVIGALPVLVFSWRYDITRDGIVRDTRYVPDEVDRASRQIGTLLVVVIAAITASLWTNYIKAYRASKTEALLQAQQGAPMIGDDGRIESIAVLPFDDFSPGEGRQFLADAIAESILHTLAQNAELLVTARTSSFYFRDKDVTAAEIGQALDVQVLLEGSVQVVDDQVRVTSQLIRTSDQKHIWSNVYEAALGDLFEIQDAIAKTVGDLVLRNHKPRTKPESDTDHPSIEIFEIIGEARYNIAEWNLDSLSKAIRLLEIAVDTAPDYADAHALLAYALNARSQIAWQLDRGTAISRYGSDWTLSRKAAERALEIDPTNGLAILMLGFSSQRSGGSRLKESLVRALEVAPNNPEVLAMVSSLEAQGLSIRKARELIRRARQVDPGNIEVTWSYLSLLCGIEPQVAPIERQLEHFSATAYLAASLRSYAFACDGRHVESALARIQATRVDTDADSAFDALIFLASLGNSAALEHADEAHILMPAMLESVWPDPTVYFDSGIQSKSSIYRWHANSGSVHLYFFPIWHGIQQIQAGDYDGARSSFARAAWLWRDYYSADAVLRLHREKLAIEVHQAWLLAESGDGKGAAELAESLYDALSEHDLLDWNDVAFQLQDYPLMVLVLSDRTDMAVSWLRQAEADNWMQFQPLLTSPVYADFREIPEVAGVLNRLIEKRDHVLRELSARNIPEIENPGMLIEQIKKHSPMTHERKGQLAMVMHNDLEQAAEHYEKALAHEPQNIFSIEGSMRLAKRLGRIDDALSLAAILASRDVTDWQWPLQLAYVQMCAGQYEKALGTFAKSAEFQPSWRGTYLWLAVNHLLMGNTVRALETIAKERDEPSRLIGESMVFHALGRSDESDMKLNNLIQTYFYEYAFNVALVHAYRGDIDSAFEWLGHAERHDGGALADLTIQPLLAPLHTDSRWHSILERRGQAPHQIDQIEFDISVLD